jgi:HK97 family phage portal protein
MGLLSNLLGFQNLSVEDPSQPLLPWSVLSDNLGFGRSDAGVLVNTTQAMRYSTIYACVKIISEDLSRLSLDIFQQLPNGGVRVATEHKNYYTIHDRPNANMSSMTWRMTMLTHMCLFGNGYSYIKRDGAARVIALIPLDPARTSAVMKNGEFMYATTFTQNGDVELVDPENMLHFRTGPSTNGISGMSPIQQCKNMVGLGIAAEKFGAQFFGNGARATGVFSHPESLDPEAYENLKKSLHQAVTGETSLRPLVLEEGMEYKQISIAPNDAQFIDTRKFQKEDIAQCFRVPLHLLQDLTRATNANLEFQGTEYVRHCLIPYAVQMEQEIKYKIIGKGPYVVEHNFQDLQRGDFPSLTTALLALRNGGVYSANDVLRGLRQNPIPEEEGGDIRIVQGAFIPLDSLLYYYNEQSPFPNPDNPGTPDVETDSDKGAPAAHHKIAIFNSFRPLFRDAVGRSINRANDPAFVKKAFHPLVNSLYQTYSAMRYGSADVSKDDLDRIGKVADEIVTASNAWTKETAAETARKLTEQCFTAFFQEH